MTFSFKAPSLKQLSKAAKLEDIASSDGRMDRDWRLLIGEEILGVIIADLLPP